jgi:hypothetical protein
LIVVIPVSQASLASEAVAPIIEQFNAFSELVEISKLNGSFSKNYGRFLGAYRYLCSIKAAGGRSFFWAGILSIAYSTALAWLTKCVFAWLHV